MMIIDDRCPKEDVLKDPWEDWKPHWTGKKCTPQDIQERHSPTEQVSLRMTAERQQHISRRRIVDARLWESMTAV